MIYNSANDQLKIKLNKMLQKALGNEIMFYNICLSLKIAEKDLHEDLKKQYKEITILLADKLVEIARGVKGTTNEEQQLKGMAIANVYILGLRYFLTWKTLRAADLAKKIEGSIRLLCAVYHKIRAAPNSELLKNMLELEDLILDEKMDFKNYFLFINLCHKFVKDKKAYLLLEGLIVTQYGNLDPVEEIENDYFTMLEEDIKLMLHADDPYILFNVNFL
jgi:hypothetical protein